MFKNLRIRIAGKFGSWEHFCGRIIAIPIILIIFLSYYRKDYDFLTLGFITFILWAVYLISHTLEKAFYGRGLR